MYYHNRMHNCLSRFQGDAKKVLSVCSAGLLRSPTIAWVLSQEPWNFNTRSCGDIAQIALIPLDPVLIEWADEIIVVNKQIKRTIDEMCIEFDLEGKPVHVLNIEDRYRYRDPELVEILRNIFKEMYGTRTPKETHE